MDIDLLSKMVRELILDNDKVTLPGVGAFVAEIYPSSFSDRGYTINPPYRRLSFRQKAEEDRLLAGLYAASNSISVDDAEKILRDFLSEMKRILFIRKVIVFPGLGRLRATKENNIFFVSDENPDIFPEGIGLEPVSLKSHQESASAIAAAVTSLKKDFEEDNSGSNAEKVPAADTADTADTAGTEMESGQEESQEPQPVLQPEKEAPQESEPETERQPTQEQVRKPVQESEQHTAKDQDDHKQQPDGKVAGVTVNSSSSHSGKWTVAGIIILVLLILLLLAAILFFIAANFFPDLLDHVLYNREELEIINYWK